MATTALEVRIRAKEEQFELARLTTTLDQLRLALSEIDRAYLLKGTRPTWVVEDLTRHAAYFLVRVAAKKTPRRDPLTLLAPIEAFVSGVALLRTEPEVPQYYTPTTVERLLRIGDPGRGIEEVSLGAVNGEADRHVTVSEPVRRHARAAVHGVETSLGSVAGWLDQMSARRVAKGLFVVGLYDPLTRKAVTGYLSAEAEDQAHRYWRRRVLAAGEITRNGRGQVLRIKISHLEPLPEDDSQRASTDDLLGADPDWINGQDVDSYVREARRG